MWNSPTWLGLPKSEFPETNGVGWKPSFSSGAGPRSTYHLICEFTPQQFCACSNTPWISSMPATGLRQPITTACSGPGAMSMSPALNFSPTSYSAVTFPNSGANRCPARYAQPSSGESKSLSPCSVRGTYLPSRNHWRVSTEPFIPVVRRKCHVGSSSRSTLGFARFVWPRNSSPTFQRNSLAPGSSATARLENPSQSKATSSGRVFIGCLSPSMWSLCFGQ